MTTVETTKTAGPPHPLDIATAEMVAGEQLFWAETSLGKNARRRILPISLLGWIFVLLSLAWLSKAATASFWLLVMGLPFVIGGIALAAMPWWWPNITRHTVYAISDRRLLIIRNWPMRKVTSYGPNDIDVIERRDRRDGSGDVVFRREEVRKLKHHSDAYGKRRVGEREIGFFGVPDVRRVEEAIWALKEKRDQAPAKDHDDQVRKGAPAAAETSPSLSSENSA